MATTTTVNGRLYDVKTNDPLSGAKVQLGKKSATTDSSGRFSIDYTLQDGETPPSKIRFVKGGYAPKSASAISQNGNLKQKINATGLKPLKLDFGIVLPQIIVFGAAQLKGLRNRGSSPEGKAIEGALNQANKIYERLIPFAAKNLSRFGIEDPSDLSEKSCPPFSEINKAIQDNNKTTRQLNNSYKTITSLSKGAKILEALLKAIKIVLKLFKKNPLPSTIGTPPGPVGGVILSQTMGNITTYDEKREKTDKFIEKLSNLLEVFPDAVTPISIALSQATSIIQTTDTAVGECLDGARQAVVDEINRQQGLDTDQTGSFGQNGFSNQGGDVSETDLDFSQIDDNILKDILGIDQNSNINVGDLLAGNYLQEQLDSELTDLTSEAAQDGQPSVTEYNGFILSVETETEEQAQGKSIKRRFAVGKDKNGVTLVKGEPSYSSNDQILLDELIFTIESNDLTAT